MSIVTDQKYAGMLAPYLRNFKRKPSGQFNFSCPYCGDSKTNKYKARGYLYPNKTKSGLRFRCFNCDATARFRDFLSMIDNNVAQSYIVERFSELKQEKKIEPAFAPPKFKNQIDKRLTKISLLDPTHPAKKYVMSRRIPSQIHYQLYHVDNFKSWANEVVPGTYKEIKEDEPRIIIPLIDHQQNVLGYQGRVYDRRSTLKYVTLLLQPENSRLYGMDRVDINKKVRVLEGPIDAMFLRNAIASCGGRIDTALPEVGISKDRAVVIYDNEPRSPFTVKKMRQAIDDGYTIVIWPDELDATDINAMVEDGMDIADIEHIIDTHQYRGLMALAKLSEWKKVDENKKRRDRVPRATW